MSFQWCSVANQTYLSLSFYKRIIQVVDEKEIVGFLGQCVDNILAKKHLRKCKIVGYVGDLGIKLPNGTYSGVLGLLQSRKVDLYIKAEPDYLHESFFSKTWPFKVEKILVQHNIDIQNDFSYFDLMNNFKLELTLSCTYLASILTVLFFCFVFTEFAYEQRVSKKLSTSSRFSLILDSFQIKKLSAIGIYIIFIQLFFLFTQLILTSNIKTNKVVVDTSKLVKNKEDIFNTKRTACFIDHEQEMNMALNSPVNSLLKRIFDVKTLFRADQVKEKKVLKRNKCLIKVNSNMADLLGSHIMMIVSRTTANVLLLLLSEIQSMKKIYRQIFGEYNVCIYYSSTISSKQEMVEKSIRYVESGLTFQMYNCFDFNTNLHLFMKSGSTMEMYLDPKEFTDKNTGFSDLVLNNFKTLFFVLFLLNLIIFFIFLVRLLIDYLKKNKITLPKLVNFKSID